MHLFMKCSCLPKEIRYTHVVNCEQKPTSPGSNNIRKRHGIITFARQFFPDKHTVELSGGIDEKGEVLVDSLSGNVKGTVSFMPAPLL